MAVTADAHPAKCPNAVIGKGEEAVRVKATHLNCLLAEIASFNGYGAVVPANLITVQFDRKTRKPIISRKTRDALWRLGELLARHVHKRDPGFKLFVVGYADPDNNPDLNMDYGLRRAQAVAWRITEKQRDLRDNVVPVSRGPFEPRDQRATPRCVKDVKQAEEGMVPYRNACADDRRVEFEFRTSMLVRELPPKTHDLYTNDERVPVGLALYPAGTQPYRTVSVRLENTSFLKALALSGAEDAKCRPARTEWFGVDNDGLLYGPDAKNPKKNPIKYAIRLRIVPEKKNVRGNLTTVLFLDLARSSPPEDEVSVDPLLPPAFADVRKSLPLALIRKGLLADLWRCIDEDHSDIAKDEKAFVEGAAFEFTQDVLSKIPKRVDEILAYRHGFDPENHFINFEPGMRLCFDRKQGNWAGGGTAKDEFQQPICLDSYSAERSRPVARASDLKKISSPRRTLMFAPYVQRTERYHSDGYFTSGGSIGNYNVVDVNKKLLPKVDIDQLSRLDKIARRGVLLLINPPTFGARETDIGVKGNSHPALLIGMRGAMDREVFTNCSLNRNDDVYGQAKKFCENTSGKKNDHDNRQFCKWVIDPTKDSAFNKKDSAAKTPKYLDRSIACGLLPFTHMEPMISVSVGKAGQKSLLRKWAPFGMSVGDLEALSSGSSLSDAIKAPKHVKLAIGDDENLRIVDLNDVDFLSFPLLHGSEFKW